MRALKVKDARSAGPRRKTRDEQRQEAVERANKLMSDATEILTLCTEAFEDDETIVDITDILPDH